MLSGIAAALARGYYDCTDEYRLQAGCAQVLTAHGLTVEREVALSAASRIDLLVGQIGIECKVDGSPSDVVRQCLRYLLHDRIAGLVLVTARARLGRLLPPSVEIANRIKPILIVETWRSAL